MDRHPGEEPELLEIERALIGGCLTDTRGVTVWPVDLMPGHFFGDRNGQIWEVMREMTELTEHPTVPDLALMLSSRGILEACGGPAYLAQCLEEGFHAVDLTRYGRLVLTGHQRRYRRALAAQLMADPDNTVALEHLLTPIGDGAALRITLEQAHAETQPPPIPTGLPPLDAVIHGVRPGQLVVVGARTSHGKSSLLAFIAWKMALREIAVDVLELEETAHDLSNRIAAFTADVPIAHADRLPDALYTELGALPLGVLRLPRVTETGVIAAVTASDAAVIMVDHIQQVPTPDAHSRAYGLEALLGRLAHLAVRTQKVIIVAAQLNRGVETRRDEPTLGDLRDSGALEQIARQVWLLYWPLKHDPARDPNDYQIFVAKQATGPTPKIALRWDARTGQFW